MPNTLKYRVQHESRPLTSSQLQTIQIPPYGKIFDLSLIFTTSAGAAVTEAQLRAEVSNIRLTINGTDFINATPAQLLDLYEHLASANVGVPAAVAGGLELNLGRLVFSDRGIRDAFGIGTADVQSIQVAVTAGTLTNVANVQAFSTRQIDLAEKLGTVCKFISYPRNFNATGDDAFDTLPRDPDTVYLAAMVATGASGVITQSGVKVNNITVRDPAPVTINSLQNSNAGFAPVTGYYIHDFMDGTATSRLPMAQVNDFRITTTFSTAPGAAGYSIAALTAVNYPANL